MSDIDKEKWKKFIDDESDYSVDCGERKMTPSQFISALEIDDAYDKLHAENARMRKGLSFLYREASVTYRYTKSNGLGGYTPLLPKAIEQAEALLATPQEVRDE